MKTFYTCLAYITLGICNSFGKIQASMLVHTPQEIKLVILDKIIDEYQSLKNENEAEGTYAQLILISRVNKELYNLLFGKTRCTILKNLVKKRALLFWENNKDKYPHSPLLHIAARKNLPSIVQSLLKSGNSTELKTKTLKRTPLYDAVEKDNKKIVLLLLKHRANVNVVDKYKMTPMHICVLGKGMNALKMLIKYKAEVDPKDNFGKTPLFYAINQNNFCMMQYLLKKGANILDMGVPINRIVATGTTLQMIFFLSDYIRAMLA